MRATLLTGAAMLAFAGNSILCRLALRDGAIDPATFTSIRLVAGAATLIVILFILRRGNELRRHGSWASALMLFVYAGFFSYAYISLSAGTGALILFAFVQGTMIAIGLWSGDRPGAFEWLGWTVAAAGLVWLVLPGIEAPPAGGAILMATAGIAWGVYSIRGRSESDPLAATSTNFVLSIAFVILLTAFTLSDAQVSHTGVLLAVVSGALTSGIGYVIWYAALEHLSAIRAALVQLTVPAIAALGGVILLGEPLTARFVAASALILGGLGIALILKSRAA